MLLTELLCGDLVKKSGLVTLFHKIQQELHCGVKQKGNTNVMLSHWTSVVSPEQRWQMSLLCSPPMLLLNAL